MTIQTLELPPTGTLWRTEQLLDLGYGSRAIRSLLESGTLVRLRHGCYIRASVWLAQSPEQAANLCACPRNADDVDRLLPL